jgi:pilus assembly protein CpaF
MKSQGYSERTLETLMTQLGPIRQHLDDPNVEEVRINAPNSIYIKSRDGKYKLDLQLTDNAVESAIVLLASLQHKTVASSIRDTKKNFILSARLPGIRVEAILPPISLRGPSMCIRKHATRIFRLEEYCANGTMTEGQVVKIRECIKRRANFLIVGGTYTGKTTLFNSIIKEIPPEQRLFTIEQVPELQIDLPDVTPIECDPENGVTARVGVRTAMRYSPDRILLGELRGEEAYDWLDACNTGHPGGGATIHADGAKEGLSRLEGLVLQAGMNMPFEAIQQRIGETVEMLFFIEKTPHGRRLQQICEVHGFDKHAREYQTTITTFGE